MRPRRIAARCIAALLVTGCGVQAAETVRNWFDDPFFAITSAIADCPLPAGPFVGERDRQAQSHRRAEKGTTCWLAGESGCERASAYAYDREIAEALRAQVRERGLFADTSLWVTVQGRVVYIEGCAARGRTVAEVEAFARAVPQVQQAIAIVRVGAGARVPYRRR